MMQQVAKGPNHGALLSTKRLHALPSLLAKSAKVDLERGRKLAFQDSLELVLFPQLLVTVIQIDHVSQPSGIAVVHVTVFHGDLAF
jgi:hypothetical protein